MAPDIFARTVLLLAGRVQRIARDEVKTSALDECRRPRHLAGLGLFRFRVAVSDAPLHEKHSRRYYEREAIRHGHGASLGNHAVHDPIQSRHQRLRVRHHPMPEGICVGFRSEMEVVDHRVEPALPRLVRQPGDPSRPNDRPSI